MDDVSRLFISIIFLILTFVFSLAYVTLINSSTTKLKSIIEQAQDKHKVLSKALQKENFKQRPILQSGFVICGSFYCVNFASLMAKFIGKINFVEDMQNSNSLLTAIGVHIVAFILTTMLLLIIGVIVPNKLAIKVQQETVAKYYNLVFIFEIVLLPIYYIAYTFSDFILTVLGYKKLLSNSNITEEEIRSLVDQGEEKGIIQEEEKQMINNIFEFGDMTASELMTHRTDIVAVDINDEISDVVYVAIDTGFSRLPVFENDIDNIVGTLNVKDLLCLVGSESVKDFVIRDFIRDVMYIPQAQKCVDLFKMFKLKKAHIAVVVDDYGGTAGIISMEDLLESIVGNIQDEYDNENEQIQKIDDNTYIVDGLIDIEDFEELFDISLPESEDEWETLNGFITNTLGKIPDDNEKLKLQIEGVLLTVLAVEDRRILKVKAQKLEDTEIFD